MHIGANKADPKSNEQYKGRQGEGAQKQIADHTQLTASETRWATVTTNPVRTSLSGTYTTHLLKKQNDRSIHLKVKGELFIVDL